MTTPNEHVSKSPKLAYSIKSFAEACEVSVGEVYNKMRSGEIKARRWGKRTIIEYDVGQRFIQSLPEWKPSDADAAA